MASKIDSYRCGSISGNYLTRAQLAQEALGNNNYFKLWVRYPKELDQQDRLTYVDTSDQNLMYSPITYQCSWRSNLSVVMKIENVGSIPAPLFIISNIVIPHTYLRITQKPTILNTRPVLNNPALIVDFQRVNNVNMDAPRFSITAPSPDKTFLRIHDQADNFLASAILHPSFRKNVVAIQQSDDKDKGWFGVTRISNFDLPGPWVTDEGWRDFKRTIKSIGNVIECAAEKEEWREDEWFVRRKQVCPVSKTKEEEILYSVSETEVKTEELDSGDAAKPQ